jgi:hypothetical protein
MRRSKTIGVILPLMSILIVGLRKVLIVERTLIIKHRSEQQARHAGRALDTG